MDDARIGRLVRALRHRRGWRQEDLADRARVGQEAVAKVEAGRLGSMRVSSIRAIVAALGLSYDSDVRGLGANEDRILDERHAKLLGTGATWLASIGWVVRSEVSYSEWGERGSIDLIAWRAATASLLVVEIKTELASVEATLRKLDEKARLATTIVRPFRWQPVSVSRLLVLPEDRTQRRRVAAHEAVLGRAFPVRSNEVRRWCRRPSGSIEGLLFLRDAGRHRQPTMKGRRERIRTPRSPVTPVVVRSRDKPGLWSATGTTGSTGQPNTDIVRTDPGRT